MDKKSEEELERIANLVTAEMIRNLNAPPRETIGSHPEGESGDGEETPEED